jgi:alginate O-acetyltransferase complex protein AlgI
MLFNSYTFAVFFTAVFLLYGCTPSWQGRKLLLLVSSYVFYAAWTPSYVFILLLSTVLDWWLARRLDLADAAWLRKLLLAISLTANLGLLGCFKYWAFFATAVADLTGASGSTTSLPLHSLVLPVGISFYTFASLSYTLDVYRRELRAAVSLSDYALFVSFFPHLVAGPILRARQFLPQLAQERRASWQQIEWGLTLLVLGLFSKAVMADFVLAPVADALYADADGRGLLDGWAGVLAFAGQIYYDFAGYSLCAIGLALCFGFEFPDNFRYPYAAAGFRDFWRRWHISLSTWLRDYLYTPLGGNRKGRLLTYRNLMLTMILGGLWHGASLMFLLWGALHGVYLCLERLLAPRLTAMSGWRLYLSSAITLLLVTITWIPFRAPDPATALTVLGSLYDTSAPNRMATDELAASYCGFFATVAWHWYCRGRSLEGIIGRMNVIPRSAVLTTCLLLIFLCSGGDGRAFIYFQF